MLAAAKQANLAAISLEEVTPSAQAAGGSSAKAPEEVHARKKGRDALLRSADEATQDERRAERAAKKRTRNSKRRRDQADAKIVARVNPGLGNPYEKRKLENEIKATHGDAPVSKTHAKTDYGKSAKLFEQLTEETRRIVRGEAGTKTQTDRRPAKRPRASAALKL